MRLLSFLAGDRIRYGALHDGGIVDLSARLAGTAPTLKALLETGGLANGGLRNSGLRNSGLTIVRNETRGKPVDFALDEIEFLPPIPAPGKIVCIGVNYGDRNAEYQDASAAPKFPSVFMRTAESLVGHGQSILRPPESEQLDYEGEIVLVIGKAGRRIRREAAWDHIAGLSLMNEGSVRDWLRHAKFNVTQGKNFERSGSWGPWIETSAALTLASTLHLTTTVNGEPRQDDTTVNLIFPFDYLISYLSSFMPLQPGDIIATGTPTGAGARFDPPKYLRAGDRVTVSVPEIGTLENRIEDEIPA